MLLLKLVLAPTLVALATLATRRWGPSVGGIVVGFPLSAGPIFLFLALEQGTGFAQQATVGILYGLVGVVAFAVAYVLAARRMTWPWALLAAIVAFALVSLLVSWTGWDLLWSATAASVALLLALAIVRRPAGSLPSLPQPWWDLWVRMSAAALLTLVITTVAGWLGPTLSGVVATYPVASTVIVTFTHHQAGADAARAMLRGSILSWFAFAAFFLVIGLALPAQPLGMAMLLGAVGAFATSGVVLWLDGRARR